MAPFRPSPADVIREALRRGLAGDALESRPTRGVGSPTEAGPAYIEINGVASDAEVIAALTTALILLKLMVRQVVDHVDIDQEATNLNIVAHGRVIAALSLAEILTQADAALAQAEARA